jgi:hypothetical protein
MWCRLFPRRLHVKPVPIDWLMEPTIEVEHLGMWCRLLLQRLQVDPVRIWRFLRPMIRVGRPEMTAPASAAFQREPAVGEASTAVEHLWRVGWFPGEGEKVNDRGGVH